ncbi:MAG: DUF445 family protein, partial [Victivallales bacterium]|nr:DUF445 family protein [Victivallales bacterium]
VSMLTVLVIFLQFAVEKSGLYAFPAWWTNYAIRILASAAIGYLTNWVAIEMLFKPFDEDKWHPFSIMTLGWWRQGMVPRNKAKIARTLGEEVKGKLLEPDKIAEELCQMIESVVKKPETQERLCAQFQEIARQNEKNIIDFIVPKIEQAIAEQFDNLIKPETVMEFWTSTIEPKLRDEETRKIVANKITDGLKRRTPQIMVMVKNEVRTAIVNGIRTIPLFSFLGSSANYIADHVVTNVIDWNDWEQKLKDKLASEDTQAILREEILNLTNRFNEYIKSDEASDKVNLIIENLHEKLRAYLKSFLENKLPEMAHGIFSNEDLAKWLRESLLPKAVAFFKDYMQREGKDLIVQKLDIAHRVEDAVNRQDMEQFYNMINSVAAKHLGAIQVLGYALGAIIGALQTLLL